MAASMVGGRKPSKATGLLERAPARREANARVAGRPRPPAQSFRGAMVHTSLPAALTQPLRRMCSQEGVTLYMALLAAAQTLLARYSNQTDISVGSPFANRNRPEIEGLIGFFANTLVMRTDLSGAP